MGETVDGKDDQFIRFRILGPVEIEAGTRQIRLARRHARHLLTILALNHDRAVPVSRLCELLWENNHTDAARRDLQVHIARLRRLLRDSHAEDFGVRIEQSRGGYALVTRPGTVDADQFRRLVRRARTAPVEQRMELYASALALWREPVLEGELSLRSRLYGELEELRATAQEEWAATSLELGRSRETLPELTRMVDTYPTRERFAELQMLALHQLGRRAEALGVYRRARTVLLDQLGLEPGPGLQAAQQAVLREPAPDATPERNPVTNPGPCSLPADRADFTGRQEQLEILRRVVPAGPGNGLRVCVISGMAGIGKTALAVRTSHELRPAFPDGQLFVNLRGCDPAPAQPADVLARFLVALGLRAGDVPHGLDARAETYRRIVAGRQVLVVLDDAAGEAQVAPLLPGSNTCSVLVTSRARLTALDGAHDIELPALRRDEAVILLRRIAGHDRVSAERELAAEMADLCGGLPLAVRIVGARLAARPHWTLARLRHRLGDARSLLSGLVHGPLDVRESLVRSYVRLGDDARRLLRGLSLLEVNGFPARAAAVVLDIQVADATDVLEEIVDARLLEVIGPEADGELRYRFHELVRVFATERRVEEDPPQESDDVRWLVDSAPVVNVLASGCQGPTLGPL